MKRMLIAACLGALFVVGCKKESKDNATAQTGETKPAAGNEGATGETKPAPAAAKNPEGCNSALSEAIAADYTFTEKCSPYTVSADFNVDGYTLTIEPGVEVKVTGDVSFNAGHYGKGKLVVNGTKEKPVKFSGARWSGLRLWSDAAESALNNVIIENAGTDDDAALHVEAGAVVLNGVAIVGAKKQALEVKSDKPLKSAALVDLSKAGGDPSELVHVPFHSAGVLGAALTVPEKSIIWVHGGLDTDVTLVNSGAPYRFPDSANIDPPEGKSAVVTVKEGVTLQLAENARLAFGQYTGGAGLKIQGTKEKPVLVTRYGEDQAATPAQGLWFSSGARPPELDFLVIENAGGSDGAAISFDGNRGLGKITNSTFRSLKGTAVWVRDANERFVAFDGNTFDGVEGQALRIPLQLADKLGSANVFTDKARVLLTGATSKDVTLAKLNKPYVVDGELRVDGEATRAAVLTIADGASLQFNDEGIVRAGGYNPAKVVAKDVTFDKLLSNWHGLHVAGTSSVELENLTISGVSADDYPLEFDENVTGSAKKITIKGSGKGARSCNSKVKLEAVKPLEKCE